MTRHWYVPTLGVQMDRLLDRLAYHQGSVTPRLRLTRSLWEPDEGQPRPERLKVQAIQRKTARPVVTRRAA